MSNNIITYCYYHIEMIVPSTDENIVPIVSYLGVHFCIRVLQQVASLCIEIFFDLAVTAHLTYFLYMHRRRYQKFGVLSLVRRYNHCTNNIICTSVVIK